MVVINGPRFSTTRREQLVSTMGWHVVDMTGYPEAVLAAEAGRAVRGGGAGDRLRRGRRRPRPVTMDRVFAATLIRTSSRRAVC